MLLFILEHPQFTEKPIASQERHRPNNSRLAGETDAEQATVSIVYRQIESETYCPAGRASSSCLVTVYSSTLPCMMMPASAWT